MNINKTFYLLTFEFDAKNEVLEIHANQKGLEKLKSVINSLLTKSDRDHVHLMTTEWGGDGLSSEKQNQENEIINHVKIDFDEDSEHLITIVKYDELLEALLKYAQKVRNFLREKIPLMSQHLYWALDTWRT